MSVLGSEGSGKGVGSGPQPVLVRFDAISEAFGFVKQQMGTWVLAMVVYLGILSAVVIPYVVFLANSRSGGYGGSTPASANIARLIFNIVNYSVNAFFLTGLYRMALKQIRGGKADIADLFSGGDTFGPMILNRFLAGWGIIMGFILCVVPGLLLAGLWMLAPLLVVDQKMSAINAMRTSFNVLKGQMWSALGFVFAAGLAGGAGFLLCGIGALFTYPIFIVAVAIVYNDFFGSEMGYAQPTIDMPLPPSSPPF